MDGKNTILPATDLEGIELKAARGEPFPSFRNPVWTAPYSRKNKNI